MRYRIEKELKDIYVVHDKSEPIKPFGICIEDRKSGERQLDWLSTNEAKELVKALEICIGERESSGNNG